MVLLQRQLSRELKLVAYLSRLMTPTEIRYAQIQKEDLAFTWAYEQLSEWMLFHIHTTPITSPKQCTMPTNSKRKYIFRTVAQPSTGHPVAQWVILLGNQIRFLPHSKPLPEQKSARLHIWLLWRCKERPTSVLPPPLMKTTLGFLFIWYYCKRTVSSVAPLSSFQTVVLHYRVASDHLLV